MSKAQPREGAAREWTQQELGGPCNEQESNPTIATSVTTVIEGNGDRVGLVMINLGTNNVFVSLASDVGSSKGVFLAPSGGAVTLDVRDDFTLVSRKWFGIAITGSSVVYVLEIVRSKIMNQ